MSAAPVPQTAKGLVLISISVMIAKAQQGQLLTSTEGRLVRYLADNAGRFVEEWELRDYLYRGACSRTLVAFHVFNVRRKLGRAFIETGDLGGYRLSAQRSAALERVCARCGHLVVEYEDEWVCYACPSTQSVDLEVGRADGAGERSGQPWTDDEKAFVLAHLGDMTLEEIGAGVNRSEGAVRGFLAGCGVRKTYVRAAR